MFYVFVLSMIDEQVENKCGGTLVMLHIHATIFLYVMRTSRSDSSSVHHLTCFLPIAFLNMSMIS